MWGPMNVASPRGRCFQASIVAWNFELCRSSAGTVPVEVRRYSQNNCSGTPPHCSLKWYVPSFGVERPKSNTLRPYSIAPLIMAQYRRWFGQRARCSRSDDADGTSIVSP